MAYEKLIYFVVMLILVLGLVVYPITNIINGWNCANENNQLNTCNTNLNYCVQKYYDLNQEYQKYLTGHITKKDFEDLNSFLVQNFSTTNNYVNKVNFYYSFNRI